MIAGLMAAGLDCSEGMVLQSSHLTGYEPRPNQTTYLDEPLGM